MAVFSHRAPSRNASTQSELHWRCIGQRRLMLPAADPSKRLIYRTSAREVNIWWRAGFVSICKCKCKCMPRSFSLDAAAGIRFTICSHEFPAALAKILELTRGSDRCSYLRTSCAFPSTLTTPSTQHPHHPHRRLITHPPTYAPSFQPL
jgi:hypothetical protein